MDIQIDSCWVDLWIEVKLVQLVKLVTLVQLVKFKDLVKLGRWIDG